MSGSRLAQLSALLSSLTGWRVQLLPGSFRGVPFYMNTAAGRGGRRVAINEFPLLDTPLLEDLGKRANEYRMQAFVVGDDYMAERDALIAACQDDGTAGILVHPTMGMINCRVGDLGWSENPAHRGGYCSFEITFHRDGVQPVAAEDTVSALLGGIASMIRVAIDTYQFVSAVIQNPALLLGFAVDLLGGAAGALLGLAPEAIIGLADLTIAITVDVLDAVATAQAVQDAFQAAAANVIAGQDGPVGSDDPVLGASPLIAPAADRTGGLAALATWGDGLSPPTGAGAALAALQAQQAAVVALVEGSAVLAVLTVYASIDFPSANAAAAARGQVLTMLDRQSAAANAAGNDDMYRAWLALGALAVRDLIQRAQKLPSLAPWSLPGSRPSLVLGQLFYQNAGRADELEILNDVPHPMFMPVAGVRLSK